MIENRFNLIDESWIPVAGHGLVSLKAIFSDTSITALGGNPVEKIAVFKLLLAIAQSAYTPKDESDWKKLDETGLSKKVLKYLETYYESFWLYGEKPFLQMPEIVKAEKKSFGCVQMMVATGNTTVVTEIQCEKNLFDNERALLLILLMGFAFGGGKADNAIVLTPGYTKKTNEKGKPSTGKPGPSLGFMGMLHSFGLGNSILNSIWLNLFTNEKIRQHRMYPEGLGVAPWELMPTGEDDDIARNLTKSLIGRLVPLSRFVLLSSDGIHYSEGIFHPGYDSGVVDPDVTVDFSAKPKPKVLWCDPQKRPWRQLISMLSFMESGSTMNCSQLENFIGHNNLPSSFSVWAGGVRVSSNAGEQYVSGSDDFIESEVQLSSSIYKTDATFYSNLKIEMQNMDDKSKLLFSCISKYCMTMKLDAKSIASSATNLYWQLCESIFQNLVDVCSNQDFTGKIIPIQKKINGFVIQVYNRICPNQTARQLESWAESKPFNFEKKKEE